MASAYSIIPNIDGHFVCPWSIDGKDLKGRIIARFSNGGRGMGPIDSLFYARLFVRAMELADAGAPIMDGLMEDEDNES